MPDFFLARKPRFRRAVVGVFIDFFRVCAYVAAMASTWDDEAFRRRAFDRLAELGWTQADLARRMRTDGRCPHYAEDYLAKGRNYGRRIDVVLALSAVLGVDLLWLACGQSSAGAAVTAYLLQIADLANHLAQLISPADAVAHALALALRDLARAALQAPGSAPAAGASSASASAPSRPGPPIRSPSTGRSSSS